MTEAEADRLLQNYEKVLIRYHTTRLDPRSMRLEKQIVDEIRKAVVLFLTRDKP